MACYTDIHWDAENQELVLQAIDETGARVTDLPAVIIALEDLQFAGTATPEQNLAQMRRGHWTDLAGAKWRGNLLITGKEADATDDGHSDPSQDIYLGGGGTAVTCQISTLFGAVDYFGVKLWTPTGGATGTEFKAAKSIASRPGTAPSGITITPGDDNNRSASDGGAHPDENQVMTQPFAVGGIVFLSAQITDVADPDNAGQYLEYIEGSGQTEREWTTPDNTPVT